MRQPQHNKRSRGRGRKPQNPANRSYESNGPDVKIRGSAAHIAEKYITLSRDAQSSGDEVSAQNYMQHAEHYLRIVAAAQPAQSNQPSGRSEQPSLNGGSEKTDTSAGPDEQGESREEQVAETGGGRRGGRGNGASRRSVAAASRDDEVKTEAAGDENQDENRASAKAAAESESESEETAQPADVG